MHSKEPKKHRRIRRLGQEASFTLLETVIALGLMVTVILEVSSIQGKSINFGEFNRYSSQASWLAQAVMAKVEWYSSFYVFKDIKFDKKDIEFTEEICPKDPKFGECPFKYDLKIEEFPLPLVNLIAGQLGGGGGEEGDDSGLGSTIESAIKNFLGEELLKVAFVEVHWPEGSKRNSVELAYLLTNQKQLDEQIFTQKPIGPEPEAPKKKNNKQQNNNNQQNGQNNNQNNQQQNNQSQGNPNNNQQQNNPQQRQ